jgi:hypothetical protein
MNAFEFAIRFIDFWIALNNTAIDKVNTLLRLAVDNHTEIKELIKTMDANVQAKIDELKAEHAAQHAAGQKVLAEIKATVEKLKVAQGSQEEAIAAAVKVAVDSNNAEFIAAIDGVKVESGKVSAVIAEADAQVEDAPVVVPE